MTKNSCRCLTVGTAIVLSFGYAFAQETYEQSIKPYNSSLARLCPKKHLENLYPGDFNAVIEGFLDNLTSKEASRWQRAAKPMCVGSQAGVSCANIAFVRAAIKLKKVDELAKAACRSKYVCSEKLGDCRVKP
jgi:hypothetical protein